MDHQTRSSSDHHSGSCTRSSLKNVLPVLLDRPLSFSFSSSFSAGGPWMAWTARHTLWCSMSKSMIFHHQRNLARQSLHLWPIVQSWILHSLPRWEFCSCCWRVRSRRVEQFHKHKHCSYSCKGESGDINSPKKKGTCDSLSLSFTQITCNNEQVLSGYPRMDRAYMVTHLCSIPLFSWFPARSGLKPSHFLFVFQHSLEPRRQDTGLIFALRLGGHRQHFHPGNL